METSDHRPRCFIVRFMVHKVFSRERGQEQQKTRPKAAEVMMTAGQKGGSGATSRRCEFDKASYRR